MPRPRECLADPLLRDLKRMMCGAGPVSADEIEDVVDCLTGLERGLELPAKAQSVH